MMSKMLKPVAHPEKVPLKVLKTLGLGSFETKLRYDLFPRPHYAYCLAYAAKLAATLGLKSFSALEFGVAGGRGMLALEDLCPQIEEQYGVRVEIYGFDTGEGLPEPEDYRDLPYIWQSGFYKMDVDALTAKLKRGKLVLGNVRDTVPNFVEQHDPAPIGAAFLDLDFWSSTRDALEVFKGSFDTILPRIFTYCDDVVSIDGGGVLCDDVGQLRAIRDYNETAPMRQLKPIAGLVHTRPVKAVWNSQIYVHHTFDHPQYNTYIHDDPDRQLQIPS